MRAFLWRVYRCYSSFGCNQLDHKKRGRFVKIVKNAFWLEFWKRIWIYDTSYDKLYKRGITEAVFMLNKVIAWLIFNIPEFVPINFQSLVSLRLGMKSFPCRFDTVEQQKLFSFSSQTYQSGPTMAPAGSLRPLLIKKIIYTSWLIFLVKERKCGKFVFFEH